MAESYHHHHHHHHHGHDTRHENQGHQVYSQQQASSQGAVNSGNEAVTEYRQQQQEEEASWATGEQHGVNQPTITVPIGALNISEDQTFGGGVQPTSSFHSVSSMDSSAEMSKYFPEAHASSVSPFRYQQEAEGQVQSTTASNSVLITNTNAFNAGPYAYVPAPIPVQRLPQPIRAPFMAQQRPIRPPQFPPGIPSYSSQIEGLSVSQAVVNDVLVDLQSKVINETLQQYQNESSNGNFLEPLPPIYIRAPQPTIILRSDLNRLRAELNRRVRPQVVYRHPGGANQFQQHRFQQNTFQVPRFPTPPQQHIPPECYGEYRNAAFANSDTHKTTTTTGDEHRKEKEERLYNQAESFVLNDDNDDNVNDNVHNAFDLQGLSTTSFDRYASPYQSSFLSNLEEHHQQQQQQQQQGNEETVLTTSDNINQEKTEDMFSRPVRPRPEITFDINNCIFRCFESHRQRVARRRAARQARKAKRHKQSQQQQQYQQSYHTDQYQNVPSQPQYPNEQTQWQSSSHYSDTIPSASVHTTHRPYIPAETYNYTNAGQSTCLPTDIQQYQSSDITSQIPFSSLSSSNITTGLPTNVQSLTNNYYQYNNINTQEPYIHSKAFEYSSHQNVHSTANLFQQPSFEQQQQQQQTSYDNSNQVPYSSYSSSVDATVPGDIQHLTSKYYQQQIPNQFIQPQNTYVQPATAFQYTTKTDQSQIPTYNYQNAKQQSSLYPYNIENIQQQQQPSFDYATAATTNYTSSETDTLQTGQNQTFDYSSHALGSSDYYQQQPLSQVQGDYGQPSGTFGYQSFDYTTGTTAGYAPTAIDTSHTEQKQTFDYSSQGLSSSDYYQQQPTSIPVSQGQGTYGQPSGTFEYTRESYQSQEPSYNYQGVDQQSSQYPYNLGDIQQQQQQQHQSFDYTTGTTAGYVPTGTDTLQTEQKQTYDYSNQRLSSSDYYQQQPTSQGSYAQPSGTFEYTGENYQSQGPSYDYQGVDQQSSQYPYNLGDIQQQDSYNYDSITSSGYSLPQADTQKTEEKQTFDYSSQALSSSDNQQKKEEQPKQEKTVDTTHESEIKQTEEKQTIDSSSEAVSPSDTNQRQPISIPISQVHDSQVTDQRLSGASVPTGTVEYTRHAYYSQEPLSDNYTTENFIEQHEQKKEKETTENITSAYPELTRGQTQSSDDRQSIKTTPFTIQQNVDTYPSQGAGQTYDLQNYTNESVVLEKSQPSVREEDQQHLLQQTVATEETHAPSHQPEQHSEIESSSYDTYSSLPPPPPATEEIDHKQESIATNTSEFPPPPPTPDRHTYQTTQQKPSSSFTSIIPTIDQSSIYTAGQTQPPLPDTQSDHETEDDSLENEEIFDLRRCIARCYAKYQDSWHKEEQQKYEKLLNDIQQPTSDVTTTSEQQSTSIPPCSQQFIQQSTSIPPCGQQFIQQSTSIPPYGQQFIQQPTSIPPCGQQFIQQPTSIPPYGQQFIQQSTSIPPYGQQFIQQPTSIPPCDQQFIQQSTSIPPYGQQFIQQSTSIPPYGQQFIQQPTSIPPCDQQFIQQSTSIPPYGQQFIQQPTSIPPYGQQFIQQPTSIPPYGQQFIQQPTSIPPYGQQFIQQPTSIPPCDQQFIQQSTSIPPCGQQFIQQSTSIPPCGQQFIQQPTSIPPYGQQFMQRSTSIPPCSQQFIQPSNVLLTTNCDQGDQSRQYFGAGEIHYIDRWTQTPSRNVTTRANTYEQTPVNFETIPCTPQVTTEQNIEYSPPLISQARHVIPTIPPSSPLPCYEEAKYEQQQQQQQQPVYDHDLPVPPHLSFNDSDYQPNLYFSPRITAQPHQYENTPCDKYEEQQQRYRAHSEPPSIQQDTVETISPIEPLQSQIFEQQPRRSVSIPMIHHQQQQPQAHMPPIRLLNNGRSYETESVFSRRIPRIDPATGLCLVPCPETRKYAHLPPHLRPELFCVELPPIGSLPPMPPPLPPPPPPPPVQPQRWCVRCCCVPGRTLIKKVVYKQVEEEKQQQQQEQESNYDYASVMDQMATRITVRYGNSLMEEGDAFTPGNYHEQLRVIDFPVYVSGKNDTNLKPLVPVN